MEFARLLKSALLVGLMAGCSQSPPESSSTVSGTGSIPTPEWARENSPASAATAPGETQPFPETDEVAVANETPPVIKSIPEDNR